jgi:hypothetical protein
VKYWLFLALILCVLAKAEDLSPHIARIEIFGAEKLPVQKIRAAIGAKEGDLLPSRGEAEERIDKISGIVASRLEAVCCEQGNLILYVGIEEKNSPHFEFHLPPTGEVKLPDDLSHLYQDLLDAVAASIRGRNADQDLTNGYSLMADPDARMIQLKMIPLVARDLQILDRAVRESADPEQRAAAAYMLQYGPRDERDMKTVVNALQYALQDANDQVRDNAVQALHAIMVGAKLHPEQHIRIEPTWYVQMMNSLVWSDRRNASLALVDLTENRDPDTLDLLREQALTAVIQMAEWHDLEHALPGFILAGRLAGLSEQEIRDAWLSGDREPVLEKARRSARENRNHRSALDVSLR